MLSNILLALEQSQQATEDKETDWDLARSGCGVNLPIGFMPGVKCVQHNLLCWIFANQLYLIWPLPVAKEAQYRRMRFQNLKTSKVKRTAQPTLKNPSDRQSQAIRILEGVWEPPNHLMEQALKKAYTINMSFRRPSLPTVQWEHQISVSWWQWDRNISFRIRSAPIAPGGKRPQRMHKFIALM